MRKIEVRRSEEGLSFLQVRGARSLPEGRSLAPRDRKRGEGLGARSRPLPAEPRTGAKQVPSKRERRLAAYGQDAGSFNGKVAVGAPEFGDAKILKKNETRRRRGRKELGPRRLLARRGGAGQAG